ncbi:MAG: hypothetical protein R3C01_04240 [Planctomycetaceae bacterium]
MKTTNFLKNLATVSCLASAALFAAGCPEAPKVETPPATTPGDEHKEHADGDHDHDAKPAEGDAKPAEGDAKPAEGDAKPAEGDAKPAEGDAKPAEGDAKPAEVSKPKPKTEAGSVATPFGEGDL